MSWFSNIFGGGHTRNPATAGINELNKIPGQVSPYYKPYQDTGMAAMEDLKKRYGQMLDNPGELYNQMGAGYKQSPGYQFQLQQALDQANNAMAMGGQAGTPQHQQLDASVTQGIASQDYEKYLNHIMDMYGKGIEGEQGFNQQGYNANTDYAQMLGQLGSAKGQYAYGGQAGENQRRAQNWSNLFQGLGAIGGGIMGGPLGTAAG